MRTGSGKGIAERDFPKAAESRETAERQLNVACDSLADSKAENVVVINISGKSVLGDYMIVATGRSARHVSAACDKLISDLKHAGFGNPKVEGLSAGDWVLIDAGDVIIHVFRPEIREFYNIEKLWQAPEADESKLH